MNFVTYIVDAVKPGGTPKRYLFWVSIILLAQVLSSTLPSQMLYEESINATHIILGIIGVITVGVNFIKGNRARILVAFTLYIVGLLLSSLTISLGITSLSGIIFMVTWAMTLFVAERREYISFNLVTLFMLLMLVSSVQILVFHPNDVPDNWIVLATGAILTAINIYLVYTDFGFDKNYYQEYRKQLADLQILSSKLSNILSVDRKIEDLLWEVCEECAPFLGLEDCVFYLFDEEKGKLVQVAAYGDKSLDEKKIMNPMEIAPEQGIVGQAFATGRYVLIEETRNAPQYIVDDAPRNSELAVPILSNGNVVGVLDSEHTLRGFYRLKHVRIFEVIAAFCGVKIAEYLAKESISAAKRLEQEAGHYRELDLIKNQFITNISHDLKTPLSLIKSPAMQIQNIARDLQIKKLSGYIIKNTEHLMRIVEQLLQLGKVEKGLGQAYIEKIETEQFFDKIVRQYQGLTERKQIVFYYSFDSFTLSTDTFRLEQIIHNLLQNAFRYTPEKGQVNFTAKRKGEILELSIRDNGLGIAKEDQERVFERFFKADNNNHEGTGIGLSLVREYTTSLHGTIDLKSTINKGSEFTICIPIETEKEYEQEEATRKINPTDSKPIMLVVEDHHDLNDFIRTFFEHDFNCLKALNGEEALRVMKKQTPDIIISDLMMPIMDGNVFVKEVKQSEIFGHIPIIVLSAKSQTSSRIDLYATGADNYLTKPFDINELNVVVMNTLEQRKKVTNRFHKTYFENTEVGERSEEKKLPAEAKLVEDSIHYITEHLDSPDLNVKSLLQHLGLGRNKYQKEIKQYTGLTPVEFIRSVRLNTAREKLRDYSLSISEVAYAVGFNNLSYFSRSFKQEFGRLPSEDRLLEDFSKGEDEHK